MRRANENLNTCNCCPDKEEAHRHYNPPGLVDLKYRIGIHGSFLERMINNLTRARIPDGEHKDQKPLSALTTREKDDPAIALLDTWAVAENILTFYQECIANEGFLRTAKERRSILELSRAIGYELSPGVAASTFLSFQIETANGAPKSALIRKGTAVQSIPSRQDENPQTFETSADLTGYPEWNKLKPQMTKTQEVKNIKTVVSLYIKGINNNLQQGDLILLIDSSGRSIKKAARRITDCEIKIEDDFTVVYLEGASDAGSSSIDGSGETVESTVSGGASLPRSLAFTGASVLNQIYGIGLTEAALQAKLGMFTWNVNDVLVYNYSPAEPPEGISVYIFRQTAACFGHNAPRWEMLPDPAETRGGKTKDPYKFPWDGTEARTIWENSQGGSNYPAHVYLERAVKGINKDTFVAFVSPSTTDPVVYQVAKAQETPRVDYSLIGKATALNLTNVGESRFDKEVSLLTREATAYIKSESLTLAELPIDSPILKDSTSLTLDTMVVGLARDQAVALTGEQADASGVTRSEVHVLKGVTHNNKRTKLEFQTKLSYSYKRDTLVLNANTVLATHGETVPKEVLGSGRGSVKNQHFTLKKPPVTFTSSSSAGGTETSLTVRVDGVRWKESTSLYPLTSEDRAYIVRQDNQGNSTVIFGDGKHGARLPTAQENITAHYRSGIGTDGEVDAESLTMLKAKPLGVKEVTNHVVASGSGDPETLENARENAPITVKSLDRIVSLQDYTDFTRAFAGIGKAMALPIWSGEQQIVHITVATERGGAVVDPLFSNLLKAINQARDPMQKVLLGSFQRRYFHLKAGLLIKEDYLWEDVEAAVLDAIKKAYSFEARRFAQPVAAVEITNLIHDKKGIIAVDIDELYLVGEDGNPEGDLHATVLGVQAARWNATETAVLPAELLIVNPVGIKLSKMKTE
jgi:hypothetical protein